MGIDLPQKPKKVDNYSYNRALFEEGKVPAAAVGLEKWRREYNESIVTDLDKLMADIEERVTAMDREKEDTVEAAEKVGAGIQTDMQGFQWSRF